MNSDVVCRLPYLRSSACICGSTAVAFAVAFAVAVNLEFAFLCGFCVLRLPPFVLVEQVRC